MEHAVIKISDLAYLIALIISLYSIYKIYVEMKKPHNDMKTKIENHSKMVEGNSRRIKDLEESNSLICKSLFCLIDHEITGNSLDKLKEIKNDLQNFLINK